MVRIALTNKHTGTRVLVNAIYVVAVEELADGTGILLVGERNHVIVAEPFEEVASAFELEEPLMIGISEALGTPAAPSDTTPAGAPAEPGERVRRRQEDERRRELEGNAGTN